MDEVSDLLSYLPQQLLSAASSPYLPQMLVPELHSLSPWEAREHYSNSLPQLVLLRHVRNKVAHLVGSFPNRFELSRFEDAMFIGTGAGNFCFQTWNSQWAVPFMGTKAQASV